MLRVGCPRFARSSRARGRAVVFDFTAAEAWSNDWTWGLPLVALTVLVHAFSLVASAIVFARDGSCAEAPVAEDPCAPRDLRPVASMSD
jgi:hypothetical protein